MSCDKIKIGFDAKRAVCNSTGLGSYSRTLINDIVRQSNQFGNVFAEENHPNADKGKAESEEQYSFYLYTPQKGEKQLVDQIVTADNLQFVYPKYHNIKLLRDLWRERFIVNDLQKDGIDVFHALSGQLPKGIKAKGIKSVVTIHDLIFFPHPEFYNSIDVQLYKHKFFSTIKEADKIIAISECTKRDILKFGNMNKQTPFVSEDKIEVVYQSFNNIYSELQNEDEKQRVKTKYSLPEKFILNVGTIERRKNVLSVVKAIEELSEKVYLVIIGNRTSYTDEVEKYVKLHNLKHRVHIFHNVNNQDLKAIYSLAQIFVYPSVYEGFGIPIVEAIANNLPVIAAKGSCLEEAGGESSYYVEPDNVEGMRSAINMLLTNEDKRLIAIKEGQKYIRRFAGTNVAAKILDLYKSL